MGKQEPLRDLAEELVQRAVEQLPEKMKYIVIQNKYHHKSIQQLSDELNVAPQTVKNQLGKAQKKIEFLLRKDHAQELSFLMVVLATLP